MSASGRCGIPRTPPGRTSLAMVANSNASGTVRYRKRLSGAHPTSHAVPTGSSSITNAKPRDHRGAVQDRHIAVASFRRVTATCAGVSLPAAGSSCSDFHLYSTSRVNDCCNMGHTSRSRAPENARFRGITSSKPELGRRSVIIMRSCRGFAVVTTCSVTPRMRMIGEPNTNKVCQSLMFAPIDANTRTTIDTPIKMPAMKLPASRNRAGNSS